MTRKFLFNVAVLSTALLAAGLSPAARANDADFDVRPVPVKTPPPSYPAELKREGVTGMVAVRVEIDESGNVVDCSVSKSSHSGFETAALEAIKGWKFKPASKGGSAVRAKLIVPIKFSGEA